MWVTFSGHLVFWKRSLPLERPQGSFTVEAEDPPLPAVSWPPRPSPCLPGNHSQLIKMAVRGGYYSQLVSSYKVLHDIQ